MSEEGDGERRRWANSFEYAKKGGSSFLFATVRVELMNRVHGYAHVILIPPGAPIGGEEEEEEEDEEAAAGDGAGASAPSA